MQLCKFNRPENLFEVEDDEIIEKFCLSEYAKDERRTLPARMALFIASDEGYQSTIANYKEFKRLMKRYGLIYHKYKSQRSI